MATLLSKFEEYAWNEAIWTRLMPLALKPPVDHSHLICQARRVVHYRVIMKFRASHFCYA
ncbi:unnamed protein product [Moneuplotes crassus]|uniref:Uncharacterized protein n=1 Tax=Euplotes crassus TaxID=5936 RepID=A0AAD1XVA5_EUPCR|nr:unnamed protein product [Moneuplotes crassus]